MIKIKETNLTFGSLTKRKNTTKIILHHSASIVEMQRRSTSGIKIMDGLELVITL